MKKWWWAVAALLVIVCFVAIKSPRQQEGTSADSKVVVLINNGPKETDKVEVKRLKEEIAQFNQIYPEIEIRWTDREYSPDSFSTSMAGGTAEDVITLWATEGYVAERGYALELTELVETWEYKSQLNMDVLKPFMRDERIYALPSDGYIMGLMYNKTLFAKAGLKPPTNWEEFAKCAKAIAAKQKGIAGFGIMGNGAEAGWGFLNWVWQAGGEFEVEENGKWKAAFDSPEVETALTFIKDLRWEEDALQSNLLATSQDLMARFAAGQIGMIFAAQDRIPALVNQYGMKLEEIGIVPLPEGPGGFANQMGGNYYIINPKSSKEVQDAAFKWITWKLVGSFEPERIKIKGEDLRAQKQIEAMTALPIFIGELDQKARQAAASYSDVLVDHPDVWQEAAKYMRPEPPFFSQQLYSEYLGPIVQAVLTQKNADPQKLITKAARGFQERFLDNLGN